jgi:alanyl-tRNA synthetase
MITSPTPTWLSVADVGQRFVDYFRASGYQQMNSSKLLSDKLPMTFVMSAGMVQFEELSTTKRSGDHFVLIQNCFRHFDMSLVGGSRFHLSLFQMPGAFAFGPIDRSATVALIWGLVTECYGFDPGQLYVTYSLGAQVAGQYFEADEITATAWRTLGLPADHLYGIEGTDNFWIMKDRMIGITDSRKCGPTTEVFYDRGEQLSCGVSCQPGCSCGRFVEFSNTLFITYQITDNDRIVPLAEPFVELVIGRERVAALLQDVDSVYAIDNLRPLIEQVGCFGEDGILLPDERHYHEWRLVDHLRALLFLFHDGAPPPVKKGGHEHIIKVLIREMLTSQRMLGIGDPGFLPVMLRLAGEEYPEIGGVEDLFTLYVSEEAARFWPTVEKGLTHFEADLRKGMAISPEAILHFEKEEGVPHLLLAHLLRLKGIDFDLAAYQAVLARFQRENKGRVDENE